MADETVPAPAEQVRVLHVDDDPTFLDLAETYLERELPDATVVTASGPEEGLELLDNGRIDCIVSDYEMPAMDGLEFHAAVDERDPELPFVLFTGKGSEEIASQALNAGVTGYFQKGGPDQYQRLANRVDHAVRQYRTRRASERYSTVLRALGYPIYVVDADREFEYVNDAFLDLVGYDRETLVGSTPDRIKTAESVERADEMTRRLVSSSGPETVQFEVDIQHKDGSQIPCRDHMAALPFGEEFRGTVGILQDISRERAQRERLARQNEHLDRVVSFISHDVQSLLGTAQTATRLAEETGDPSYVEQALESHDRIEQLIDELVTLARTGEAVTTRDCVALSTLTENAWTTVTAPDGSLSVADELAVEGDRERLRRLLENLLHNAATHAGVDVTVTVGALEESGREGFYVADDGPGIAADDRGQVLDIGYTTDADGTGFGLAIVRRIAHAHGWEVSVTESRAGGARFEFEGVDTYPVELAA